VDVLDKFFRAGLLVAGGFGRLGSGGIDCSLVVEAVQVAAGLLEILDPFLRLLKPVSRMFSFVSPRLMLLRLFQVRTSAIIMWQSKVPFP
jgi:hypothetical protein